MENLYFAIKTVLRKRSSFLIFLFSSIIFFGLFIAIPLITIPGNDLAFQLKIFRAKDYALMIFLAVLIGLNFALNWYSFKLRQRAQDVSRSVVGGTVSGIAGVFGAIVGTAACASCLAVLFGLIGLGVGSVFFVLKNQSYFLLGAIVLMIISLYFAARKVNGVCDSC